VDREGEVTSREDLIVVRMRQLDQQTLCKAQASANFKNSRRANKAQFDRTKRLRTTAQQLPSRRACPASQHHPRQSHSHKLDDKCRRPYGIREIPEDSTHYLLEELDGTSLAASFSGNRLQRIFSRTELDEQRGEMHDPKRVRDFADQDDDVEEEEELMDSLGRENMDVLVDEDE
jgi:hypothetical protein